MPFIPTPTPGMLVVHWPEAVPGGSAGEATCRLFATETAPKDAKRMTMDLLSRDGGPVRVFALVELFHQVGETTRIIPNDWAPAVDLIVREQLAGKGMQVTRRGPPKEKPEDFMARVAAEAYAKKQQMVLEHTTNTGENTDE